MSLSDCPKCWDTLCCCGWEYREWDKDRRIGLAASAWGVNQKDIRALLDVPEEHPLLRDESWNDSEPTKELA